MYDRPRRSRSRKHLGAAILAAVLVAAPVAAPLRARAETVELMKGDPSPINGLVMDEATFKRYANADIDRAKCQVDLTAANAAIAASAAEKASAPAAPAATSSGYFWVGVGVGVGAAVLVLYGAAQLLKAAPAAVPLRARRAWEVP